MANLRVAIHHAPLLLFILLLATVETVDAANNTCINEETRCTCSQKQFKGLCTRPRGGGKCIETACNPTMICDCLGFEVCDISPCGQHIVNAGITPSTAQPFDCHFEADSNTCRVSSGVMATVSASNTAREMSNMYVDQIADYQHEASLAISAIVQHYSDSLDAVRKVEQFETQVSSTSILAIRQDLDECESQMHDAQRLMGELFDLSERVYESMKNTKKFRQQAIDADELAIALVAQRDAAMRAAEEEGAAGCPACDAMQAQIDVRQVETAEAAAASTTWAKTAREDQNESAQKKGGIEAAEKAAGVARNACLAKSEDVLASIVAATAV